MTHRRYFLYKYFPDKRIISLENAKHDCRKSPILFYP